MKKIEFCEVMGDINEDYIKSAHAPRVKRQPVWVKWGAMAACLCLIVTAVVALPQLTARPSLPDIDIVVNPYDNDIIMSDIDAQVMWYYAVSYDLDLRATDEEREYMKQNFTTNVGLSFDDFILSIPKEFRDNMDMYTLSVPSGNGDGQYTLHDWVFEFREGFHAEDAKVAVSISHVGKPLRCWFGGNKVNAIASNINGTDVTVYDMNGCYIVQFIRNNIYYDIIANDMEIEQLKELLGSILYAE